MSLDDKELSSLIRQHATRHAASDRLRAAVRAQVALVDAGRVPVSAAVQPARRRWFGFGWATATAGNAVGGAQTARPRWFDMGWATASVGFAVGILCTALALPWVQRLNLNESLEADLVADHVRALQVGPIAEVLSSDRHTVKPWFQGRLDYAPPVFDLADEGFPLLGGRIEHVRGNPVAALSYTHNRHVLDVFVWPTAASAAPIRSVRRGFNVEHWADDSMQYWAVSDMDPEEMASFASLWQKRAVPK